MRPVEAADAVVVGARMAGTSAAIPLVRAGRRVIVLDRARFPSNTLSTHGIWPNTVAELSALGALDHVMEYEPPRMEWLLVHHGGVTVRKRFKPVGGMDFALCIPRTQLDTALLKTAREAGVDVRERSTVTDVVRDGSRVTGVVYTSGDEEREIRAPLVIGADGRRSRIAELVGVSKPYRGSRNGRGFAWWYVDDPKAGTVWQHTAGLWRVGDTVSLVGSMPDDRLLVLAMAPVEHIPRYRRDPQEAWEALLREHRHLAERVRGMTRPTRLFTATQLSSFFRASSGPGWALTGDAGHFKDPVIAQGIGDAVRSSRLLGESVAPVLDDPEELDDTLRRWEQDRDRYVLSSYHWANRESRTSDPVRPVQIEALEALSRDDAPMDFSDLISRQAAFEDFLSPRRTWRWALRALARPGADRRMILRQLAEENKVRRATVRERRRDEFRSARPHPAERDGWEWPPRRLEARRLLAGEEERAATEDRTRERAPA